MLDNAVNMLTQGVTFLGGVLVVFGLINLDNPITNATATNNFFIIVGFYC